MTHTDEYGRRLSLNVEELTITETTCTGEKVTATAALPEGTEGLSLLRSLMEAMALDMRYDLVAKDGA